MINTELLERDGPIAAISDCVTKAGEGDGSVVLISGEAGLGKTTVLIELARRHAKFARILIGYCDASKTPQPLGALSDFAEDLGPEIVDLLRSGDAQHTLFPAVIKKIHNSKLPVVMIIEDAHWADSATLDLVRYLGRRVVAARFVLILSFRNDEVGVDHPLTAVLGDLPSSAVRRIVLETLTEGAVAQMSGAEGKRLLHLCDLTGGNPLFLTELLAHGGPGGPLPTSIRDAVWSRLSRISDGERQSLCNLSVVPVPIEHKLAEILVEGKMAEITNLVGLGLLRKLSTGNLMFRHELARLATLESIQPAKLQQLHAIAENAIVQMDTHDIAGILTRRVHHAEGAGDARKVLELAPLAAAEARRLGAHEQAASLLELGLQHVKLASPEQAAQLYEDWAYEVGLSKKISEDVINACHRAADLWLQLRRPEKVSKNYRWLSRFHWYRGETQKADEYLGKAEDVLSDSEPGPDLAMVYSMRSQNLMLREEIVAAIDWGERAIALAKQFNDTETLTHALNNVGTCMLAAGDLVGKTRLQESLDLALSNGFHEQAARAYTNFSEAALNNRDFALAERLFAEGIAFDTKHDLDSWTHYLSGGFARLRVEQGRFEEAIIICTGILNLERLTMIMKMPAKIALCLAQIRLGKEGVEVFLKQCLDDGVVIGEPQYLLPCFLGLVELAWLAGDEATARKHLQKALDLGATLTDPWQLGEMQIWAKRLGVAVEHYKLPNAIAQPFAAELNDDNITAAALWDKIGSPYHAAISLAQTKEAISLADAIKRFEKLGAKSAIAWLRRRADGLGLEDALPKLRRGPYRAARSHPMGLTEKEVNVLALLSEGHGNFQIAKQLNRSQRTIEHHVAAVLAKLNANNRIEVILRLQSEPWLLQRTN
jgi:DNA-binding CsgD family transcriptional regulator/tetratricopeptide (TPR) repeat protein